MLLIRATNLATEERSTLTVVEGDTIPRLRVIETDGEPLPTSLDYVDIGHFLEEWTRVRRVAPDA